MRAVILTWEYPPRIVGDIAHRVKRLAQGLSKGELDVHVITFHDHLTGLYQESDGVKVWRVSNPVKTHINVLTWDLTLMTEFVRVASDVYYSVHGEVDLIDAHEWLCITAAVSLKKAFDIPFIYTIYSLEDHRASDVRAPLSVAIKNLEWLGMYEAERVVVDSHWMKGETSRVHGVPPEKVDVVSPNTPSYLPDVIEVYERVATRQGAAREN